ncbi:MAG: hypothetical protein H6742_09785 [Alphaproteobacteria bacterium]|nr:hypothetical protein [Alphaproteobacteria bacterium]
MSRPASDPAARRVFVAPCARGLESVLLGELDDLGLEALQLLNGAVRFQGPLEHGYRALMWSRVASRVLVELVQGPAWDSQSLYDTVREIDWIQHADPDRTMAVDFVGRNDGIRHSGFGARRIKDAVCDSLRDRTGRRPGIDLKDPDLRLHAYLEGEELRLSVDLAGEPLHLRSGGVQGGRAPLKETLAAALLLLAGWPQAAQEGRPLVDPMCGSGTFLREGAAMARGDAPGLMRTTWGFHGWRGHHEAIWQQVVEAARSAAPQPVPPLFGFDADRDAIEVARHGLRAQGLQDVVSFAQAPLSVAEAPCDEPGMLVVNPPYGERIGDRDEADNLMGLLGDILRRRFLGWHAWILAGSPRMAKRLGLRPAQRIPVWNGRIECRWLEVPISAKPVARDV